MNDKHYLLTNLRTSLAMFDGLAADLSPADMLHRPCDGGNCAAWIIGHLVLSERSMASRFGPLATDAAGPAVPAALPDGFEQRFARNDTAPRQSEYGDTSILMPLLRQARAALIAAVERADDAAMAQPLQKPHPLFATNGAMANFAGLHLAMHAGHLSTIRRSLGRPALI